MPGMPANGRPMGTSRHGWAIWVNVTCVECPDCGFTMDHDHEDADGSGYTCPNCATAMEEAGEP